jgi:NHS family xanthosine MFS transporter
MTNGIGAILGSVASGWVIKEYFTKSFTNAPQLAAYLQTEPTNSSLLEFVSKQGATILVNGNFTSEIALRDWPGIWTSFAVYALVIAIAFAILFRHKHNKESGGDTALQLDPRQ